MDVAFEQVDVFTDRPFAGNALCVIPEATGLSGEQMQAIAREMNLSETTFVLPPTDPQPGRAASRSRSR
jgi:trans-2,3-dihydro-3-hydroxyanthranilate isomerase